MTKTDPPYNLKVWHSEDARFWTCGRPGRELVDSRDRPRELVPESAAHAWALGILRRVPGERRVVVSLLGEKPIGVPSEFRFYKFLEGRDDSVLGRRAFRTWVEHHHPELGLIEHPTMDLDPIDAPTRDVICGDVRQMISDGVNVVVMDSGGEGRTGQVGRLLGAKAVEAP